MEMTPYLYNLGKRFERIVASAPEKTALWFSKDLRISYRDLNDQANCIARWLLATGVHMNDIVCVSAEKTATTYASLVACLKVGAGYATLDPDSPSERISRIVERCKPERIIAGASIAERLAAIHPELRQITVNPEAMKMAAEAFDKVNLPSTARVTGNQVAYIMFTSGSTGFPKGATMTHANVLNLIDWARTTYGISPEDVCTNVNPLFFDNSVFDIYSSLFNGATLVVFTKEETRDPKQIVDKVAEAGCSQWFSVPSLLIFLQTMKAADGKRLRSVTRFIFGGEGYPKAKLKQLYDSYKETATLHNVYGPTECTCICSSYQLSESDFADINGLPPLGGIAPNFDYQILDVNDQPAEPNAIGELCLLGPNVGRGYFNDPERTAVAFVQNPNNSMFPEIMYRTGDMVRYNPEDGKIYIHGRKDNQIKHMGYRIELEEIDAGMHCLPYVNEATALHVQLNGFSRIVAVASVRESITEEAFQRDLRMILPDYMIPQKIHRMALLPKNANGKVDRKTLAEMAAAGLFPEEG